MPASAWLRLSDRDEANITTYFHELTINSFEFLYLKEKMNIRKEGLNIGVSWPSADAQHGFSEAWKVAETETSGQFQRAKGRHR